MICFSIILLPQVRKALEPSNHISTNAQDGHEKDIPYAEIILCCGFLLIYFIEELVLSLAKEPER